MSRVLCDDQGTGHRPFQVTLDEDAMLTDTNRLYETMSRLPVPSIDRRLALVIAHIPVPGGESGRELFLLHCRPQLD